MSLPCAFLRGAPFSPSPFFVGGLSSAEAVRLSPVGGYLRGVASRLLCRPSPLSGSSLGALPSVSVGLGVPALSGVLSPPTLSGGLGLPLCPCGRFQFSRCAPSEGGGGGFIPTRNYRLPQLGRVEPISLVLNIKNSNMPNGRKTFLCIFHIRVKNALGWFS